MTETNPENLTMTKTNPPNQITTTNTTQNHDLPVAIPGIKLNGQNYDLWSQIIQMLISGRDKLGLITGEITQPPSTNPL